MRTLVSGSTGLVGRALVSALGPAEVVRLVRGPAAEGQISWAPVEGQLDEAGLTGVRAVVHLAGEPLAARRWTAAQKRRIRDSRVAGTRTLSEALSRMEEPPAVMVSASAVGWYGDRGDEALTEQSEAGDGFLAEVCRDWEDATRAAESAGVRVVNLRSGIVLSASGGVLARQLPLFKLGLGGRLGSGRQFTSWISLEDEIGVILHCLETDDLSGPVNATAPSPVTNAEMTDCLAALLGRPARLAVPGLVLSAVFGAEMAREVALASQRALPARLEQSGYRFAHPQLAGALR